MNKYIAQIIQLLISNGGQISVDLLLEQMKISKRMIDYYLKQFDDWRLFNNFPKIELNENHLSINIRNKDVFFKDFVNNYSIDDYYLSANERIECIILYIGISKEIINTERLINMFLISKNTISNDLFLIKQYLGKYNVSLESKGKSGYYFVGREQDIRYVLMQVYHRHDNALFHKYKKELIIHELKSYKINHENIIQNVIDILLNAEKENDDNYIFFALYDLIETILLIICRQFKREITFKNPVALPSNSIRVMMDIKNNFEKIGIIISDNELYYLYLILQSAKVNKYNQEDFTDEIIRLTDDIVNYFKSISQLNIFDQSELYNMFLIHVKSMFFRTRYKIKITNFRDSSSDDLYGFYCIANKVLEKVAGKYDLTYDEDEIKFLSYYFASLEYASQPIKEDIGNILVVCVAGLGSSMYLKSQCMKIFDKSYIINITDSNNIAKYINEKTKLVISTISINISEINNIQFFKVHPILTENERHKLTEWYFFDRFSFSQEASVISDVMDIINTSAVIKNKDKLFRDLNHYFSPVKLDSEISLKEIFGVESITEVKNISSLKDLIYKSGTPLLANQLIRQSYLDHIVKVLKQHGPYCECFEEILVAHAIPDGDVEKPCLSLGICKNSYLVKEWNKKIKAVFILGVTDTESHCSAFTELIHALTKNRLYERINRIDNPENLYAQIINYEFN